MLRDTLASASVYSIFARAIGARRARALYVEKYIRPSAGNRVLDIGCGPAEILEALPNVVYHGCDVSADYIASARRRFGDRGVFDVAAIGEGLVGRYSSCDVVLATGVLHHLSDSEAATLFRVARASLRQGGALVTLDGCFVEGQSRLARGLLLRDRGRFVRTREQYERLARGEFSVIESSIRHDLLRIPYTHLIMRCTRTVDL